MARSIYFDFPSMIYLPRHFISRKVCLFRMFTSSRTNLHQQELPWWSSGTSELTHFKRPWCWERLKAGGEGSDRGCDDWMASPTWWTWVWVSSRSRWWTGKPGLLQSMGSQRVRHNWATELNMLMTRVWENWQFSLFVVMNISWHKSYKEQFSHIHQNYRCTLPFYPESFNFRNGSY